MFYYSVLFLALFVPGLTLSDEHHCSKFHYEEKLLEKMIRMEMRLEKLQERLDDLQQQQTTHIGSDTVPKQSVGRTIAFFATSTKRRNYQANEILIFDKVTTNQGGAYHAGTGVFTTPEPGTYVFFSTVLSNNDKEIWNNLSVNGQKIANFNAHGTEGRHGSGSATVVVQLSKGDKVTVNNLNAPGDTYGGSYTHFGGFRLPF